MDEDETPKCPECGTKIYFPLKIWTLRPKGRKTNPPLRVALYECSHCFKRWRRVEKK